MNKDLYEYARQRNIVIERMKLQKNKSLSVRIQNRDFIGIADMDNSAEERTHLAHEIGHCETGAFYEIGSPLQVRGKAERKAVKWAVLKCIPKQELTDLLKQGLQTWEIAEHFNVTEDFVNTAYKFYFVYGIAV